MLRQCSTGRGNVRGIVPEASVRGEMSGEYALDPLKLQPYKRQVEAGSMREFSGSISRPTV